MFPFMMYIHGKRFRLALLLSGLNRDAKEKDNLSIEGGWHLAAKKLKGFGSLR